VKFAPPISNKLALLATVAAAAGFFVLLMMLPEHHQASRPVSSSSGRPTGLTGGETAEGLFATRCTQCHALPALTHRPPEDWRILVLKMNRYMKQTGRQFLTDDQMSLVTHYIVQHQK
jgi:hypothetical protein